MREDMFKVIVERPRWASRFGDSPKLKRRTHPDRKQIGMKRHAWESSRIVKAQNENLAPLKRYLWKQRGRPWDKVFSEICERLDTGNTVKMHVREHIEDFINVNVWVDCEGNWLATGGRWGSTQTLERWWQELYVDPNDGLIKETEKLRRKLRVERKRFRYNYEGYDLGPFTDFVRLAPDLALMQRKGLWFEFRLDRDPMCRDALLRHELIEEVWRQHERWQLVSVKQLAKKELKSHGLENSQADA